MGVKNKHENPLDPLNLCFLTTDYTDLTDKFNGNKYYLRFSKPVDINELRISRIIRMSLCDTQISQMEADCADY